MGRWIEVCEIKKMVDSNFSGLELNGNSLCSLFYLIKKKLSTNFFSNFNIPFFLIGLNLAITLKSI